jgi:UDP-N-acetylmuramoylalanine--D-glutamate ligase
MKDRITILGAGESGVGAALLARRQGYKVFVSDSGVPQPAYARELKNLGIAYEFGRHTESRVHAADLIIKSPGISDNAAVVQRARGQHIRIISEIEFASWHTDATIVAVTGTNGKTTTTSMTHHILQKAGKNVAKAGNIGKSFARTITEGDFEYYALEVSSFQLDGIETFRPHIAILLNITPDHLDRYDQDVEKYISSKFLITKNQTSANYFVYNLDDEIIRSRMPGMPFSAKTVPISIRQQVDYGAWANDQEIHFETGKTSFAMKINELALQGKHNTYNSMAAGIAARITEIRKEDVREGLADFKAEPHRLEKVGKVSGVDFINDSKATNVNAAWYALESMEQPVIWIAGGVDKGNDYSVLEPLVRKHVKAIVCLGLENVGIHEAFGKKVDIIVNTSSMKEAVRMAHHLADKDEVVLLSPACASFDLFENYEDRGNQFKAAVRDL